MTLDGTNTWLLSAPGATRGIVIDPGPDDEQHLKAVLDAAEQRGITVAATLLTHGHVDHSESAKHFAELTGAPVRALDPAHRYGEEGLSGGDVIEVDGLRLDVVATPGHTADSLSFLLPQVRALLTGDMVLGRGTTVVAHPDGRLDQYLDSMNRLNDLAAQAGLLELLLPGHGPVLTSPAAVIGYYLTHRQARLEQVRAAVAAGATTAPEVVAVVYADVAEELLRAAKRSVKAQLTYLGYPQPDEPEDDDPKNDEAKTG
jgi:glyoxylase-like metal-dependent hydrolase (beta-lactamase superfamily II)